MSVRAGLTEAQRALMPNLDAPPDRNRDEVAAMAVLVVDRFAPSAPDGVKTMAAARVARWMLSQALDQLDKISFGSDGGGTTGYQSQFRNIQQSALRGSGAMSMLAQWRVRRAGVIG